MFWRGQSKSTTRSLRCFYCNEHSNVTFSGRLTDWQCPLCDALNILDEDGTIADEVPAKYQINEERPNVYSISGPNLPSLSTPFCSVCASNQALLVKTLASYLPDDDHPDIAVYEKALPAYKASLEERYPQICSACAPNVQARLQRNNYIAKSTALGNWLISAKSSPVLASERSILTKLFMALLWSLRGGVWITASVTMLVWFGIGAIAPGSQKSEMLLAQDTFRFPVHSSSSSLHISQDAVIFLYKRLRFWLPVSLIGALWIPKGLSIIFMPTVKVRGKEEHFKLQVTIQVLRLLAIYLLPLLKLNTDIHMRLSVLFLVLSALHLLITPNMIKLVPPTQVDLKGQSFDLNDLAVPAANLEETTTTPHKTILDQSQSAPQAIDPCQSDHEGSDEEDKRCLEDTMDWQPSPSATRITNNSPFSGIASSFPVTNMFARPAFAQPREQYFSTNAAHQNTLSPLASLTYLKSQQRPTDEKVQLAQQKFFAPERPSGLENLFSAAVRLDDEPLLVRSLKSIQRDPIGIASVMLFLSFVLLPLWLARQDVACVISGLLLMLTSGYLGLLRPLALVLALPLWSMIGAARYFFSEKAVVIFDNEISYSKVLLGLAVVSTVILHASVYVRAKIARSTEARNRGGKRHRTRRIDTQKRDTWGL